jgi:hypothetical protein
MTPLLLTAMGQETKYFVQCIAVLQPPGYSKDAATSRHVTSRHITPQQVLLIQPAFGLLRCFIAIYKFPLIYYSSGIVNSCVSLFIFSINSA